MKIKTYVKLTTCRERRKYLRKFTMRSAGNLAPSDDVGLS